MANRSKSSVLAPRQRLLERIDELEETLRAIRAGEVDAVVVDRLGKRRVFTLEGADSAFRRIVEQMNEGALTIRPDGTVLYCNRRFSELVKQPPRRVIGSALTRFVPGDLRMEFEGLLKRARAGPVRGEFDLTGSRGVEIPVLISMSSLKDNKVPALCVSVADLSAHKRQAELASFSEELERRVSSRTSELSLANRELEAFSYSASHDLRGPLRSISGFSELLERSLRKKLSPLEADYLSRIREGAGRMERIIEALLALSRASKGHILREPVDLCSMAQEIAAELCEASPKPAVHFRCQKDLIASGDPRLLRQLLQNLLANAWKFARPGARARVTFDRAGTAFRVADNGLGFDAAYAQKIFEPFQRLHPEFEGTGIGLALAKRIVERHGGHIWAEGKPGRGAAFLFTLPGEAVHD